MKRIHEYEKQRLMIVDDDQALLFLFSMALESVSLQCDCASGGEEALGLLGKNRYDLVLLDLRMPNMSGLEVLTRMRDLGDFTQVVIMSAFVPGSAVLQAAALGVTTFLGKPVTIQFLREMVRTMLDGEVHSDFDLAREYAGRLDFESAHRVLVGKKDTGGVRKSLWADLFRVLATKGEQKDLDRLEGPSERLVTLQF